MSTWSTRTRKNTWHNHISSKFWQLNDNKTFSFLLEECYTIYIKRHRSSVKITCHVCFYLQCDCHNLQSYTTHTSPERNFIHYFKCSPYNLKTSCLLTVYDVVWQITCPSLHKHTLPWFITDAFLSVAWAILLQHRILIQFASCMNFKESSKQCTRWLPSLPQTCSHINFNYLHLYNKSLWWKTKDNTSLQLSVSTTGPLPHSSTFPPLCVWSIEELSNCPGPIWSLPTCLLLHHPGC